MTTQHEAQGTVSDELRSAFSVLRAQGVVGPYRALLTREGYDRLKDELYIEGDMTHFGEIRLDIQD